MSSYLHFFVRKHNEFAPIGTYGRSTKIYELFNHMTPYGKIAPLTYSKLNVVKDGWRKLIDANTAAIGAARKRIALIPSFSNSIEDKMDALTEEESFMEELVETQTELTTARAFIGFLFDVLDAVEYGSDETLCADEYIYIGIECGGAVTAQDIAG